MEKETINKEIKKCIGPHAFLLVTSTDRFTEQSAAVFSEIDAMFGENLKKYLIVVFTHKEKLRGRPIDEFTAEAPEKMNEVLKSAGGGIIAFNNDGNNEEKNKDVKTLLNHVESLIKLNHGSHFTSEMFEEAGRIMRKRIEEELKKKERRKEIRKLQTWKRSKLEKNFYKKLQENSEANRKEMEELKAEREKEKIDLYSSKEKDIEELERKKFEKVTLDKRLSEKKQKGKDKDREAIEQQLARVNEEINENVAERERVKEEIVDEILSALVRMEERDNIKNETSSSYESFFKRIAGRGERFLKFFKQTTKSWKQSKQ